MNAGRVPARRGRIALLCLLACGAFLGSGASTAGAQSISNTASVGSPAQTVWLTSFATSGESGSNSGAKKIRLSMLVSHATGSRVDELLIDQNWDGDSNDMQSHTGGLDIEQPTVAGGFNYTRVNYEFSLNTDAVGGTTRTADKTLHVRAVLDSGGQTGISSTTVRFVPAGGFSGLDDPPYIFQWTSSGGNFFRHVTPGNSFTFTYRGDDPDSNVCPPFVGCSDDDDFDGVRWRVRDQLDGNPTTGTTEDCNDGNDNSDKHTTVTFNDRGTYAVEGEGMNEGCDLADGGAGGRWLALGSVDVNSNGIGPPTGLTATRPVTNGNVTLSATMPTDPESGDPNPGRVQYVEWDVDGNLSNGTNSFDKTTLGNHTSGLTGVQSTTHDTEGMAPGTYTWQARVTDNGAMSGADSVRDVSSTVSGTYVVNSPPEVNDQTVTTDTGVATGSIAFGGTDDDSDTITYSITDAPNNGTLSGSGSSRNYTPNAGFAGVDSFQVTANDGFGGTDTATITVNVRPGTNITATPPNPSNDATPQFQFNSNATVGGITFECRVTGEASFTACTSPKTYGTLSNGSKTFEVRAKSGSLVDASPATYTWTIDTVAPNTQIDGNPATPTNSTSATFSFSGTGSPSGFECRLDGSGPGGWTNCTSPQSYSGLTEGSHTFEVRAEDAAGNVDSTPASFTWTIDTTGPTTTINTFPDDPTNVTSASFSFTANEPVTGFECELDGGGFSACTSPQAYAGPLDEGPHTFKVRSTDTAGNLGAAATHTWDVDLTPADTTITDNPPALTNQAMADFSFSSEAGATFQCRLDSTLPAAWEACTSPKHYASLTHGSHTFEVRATDEAGNTDPTPATYTWNVDLVNPNTAIDDDTAPGNAHPSHRTTDNNASFDFFSSDGTATFECRVDGTVADFVACTSPKLYAGLTDGVHVFHVRAKDPAGNYDPTPATWTWEIYNGLPDTIFDDTPPAASNSANDTFEFHSTIPDSTFECSFDGGPLEPCTSPVNLTGLSESTHTFSVVATDEFGRTDPAPAVHEWTVDLTDPDTEITAQPSDPTADDFALFQFESNEAGAVFQCKLDSGAWEDCGDVQPQQYTGLDDGPHTFQVKAIDPAGNEDGTPASYTWTVDTEAPDTNITNQPGDPSNINDPAFEFTSTQTGSTFECRLDSNLESDWEPCTSGHQYDDLTETSHTFEVRATDPAGNVDASPASYTWTVDLTAPDTTIDPPTPDDPTNETLATFNFSGNDSLSDPSDLSFECRIDSDDENDWASCSSPEDFSGLAAGEHTVEVRATDEAGNTDQEPASFTWTIDLTAPDATIDSGPDDPTPSTSADFTFSSEDGASFECRLDSTDDNDWEACSSPQSYPGPLSEGPHVFEVRATDTAGNTGPVATHTWNVDVTEPDSSIDTNPDDPTNDTSPSFGFSGTDNHSGAGDLTFECQLDGGGFEDCSSPQDYPGPLGEGSHTFDVRATDEAGNLESSPASYTWVVDTGAPETNITDSPDDPTNVTSAHFEFNGDDGTGSGVDKLECKLDDGPYEDCSAGSIDYAGPLSDGSHTFLVKATDEAGNVDGSPASYTWEVDTGEPETSIGDKPNDPSNVAGPQFTFSSNEDGSTFECELDGGGFAPCTTPHDLTGLGDGSHTFAVRATDPAGNTDSTPATYTWLVDLTEPDSTITGQPADPSNDTSPSFDFTGGDGAGSGIERFECKLDAGDWEECTSTHTAGVTGDGPHTFSVRAVDSAGNTESSPDSYTWTLDTTPPAVDITDGPVDPTNSDSGTLTFTRGGDAVTVVCELDGAPAPGSCPSGSIPVSGLSDGPHTFKVTVSDAAGNTNSDEWTWTVDTAEPETTIDETPGPLTTADQVRFAFSSSQDPSTYECRFDAAPFAPCASPAVTPPMTLGTHTFSVRATDAAGNTDSSPATHAFDVAANGVLGNEAPVIKRRIRALNVPLAGSFQVATVSCRAGTCRIDQKSAKIKVGGKTYNGQITVEVERKNDRSTLSKGEIALVIAHFPTVVQRELVANHTGQLIVKLAASTDAGGSSTFKKIKLKAKWLKKLFR